MIVRNAKDVLDNAHIFSSIQEAVKSSKMIYATSARDRTIEWPTLTANEAASEIQELVSNKIEVSILFGRESAGVPESVHQSVNNRLKIPMNASTRSLNIASSVAIVLAESLRQTELI